MYCSQLWRPRLIKDMHHLLGVSAAQSYQICFKWLYIKLQIQANLTQPLPSYMYVCWLEIQDLLFLIKCIKYSPDNLNIFSHISFVSSCARASSSKKLKHNFCQSLSTKHFYFNRIVYLWNALPPIYTSQSYTSIKRLITNFLSQHE